MIFDGPEKQPMPPGVEVPFSADKRALYSAMPIDALMVLRDYLDALIKWKAKGNPVYIGSMTYKVEVLPDLTQGADQ